MNVVMSDMKECVNLLSKEDVDTSKTYKLVIKAGNEIFGAVMEYFKKEISRTQYIDNNIPCIQKNICDMLNEFMGYDEATDKYEEMRTLDEVIEKTDRLIPF